MNEMQSLFKPAHRQKAKLRMALAGVSGGGKTLGALYIAYGITGDWSRVALIDTERERARLYAERSDLPYPTGSFLHATLDPPYSVERYKMYVQAAAQAVGPQGVVIIDSLSPAWNNEGGVLDYKEQVAAQRGKNSYTAWNEAGQLQNSLVNTILSVPCHTIATLRVKTEYALETNDRGKQQPVKLGLAPVQRDDMEYEFDIVLNIGRDHTATASKDVTFLDQFGQVITPELGERLIGWLDQGQDPPKRYYCEDCGQRIMDSPKATAERRAQVTKEEFGRQLCEHCTRIAYARRKREEAERNDSGEPAQN
ncbi:AAA family ATPase [Gemmiger sp. An50]|uniref:AAA family ATPase n=1 Tax=Gemmiger sp. An50 TaxID=1965639 RepID=UPI001FA8D891|nr:AAA family ATPase [Gemmiger sp. An50]